jgi:CTP:molybdopterin cytidylyltransferase MocA
MSNAIPAIILAAGASRRLGQPKQLVVLQGETLLGRALRLAKEAGAAPVLAVLGANFAQICAALPFGDALPVLNDHWEDGISSSIHAGLNEAHARAPEAQGVLVMACDQPRLSSEHLRALLLTFEAQSMLSIVASSYAGTRGIPAIFPRSAFAALQQIHGDRGARALLAHSSCPVVTLPFEGGEMDIDTKTDLAELE